MSEGQAVERVWVRLASLSGVEKLVRRWVAGMLFDG